VSRIFKTDGPLGGQDSRLYVKRPEDRRVLTEVQRGNYVTLLGARRTGKTSLLLRLRRRLLKEGHLPVYVDVAAAGDRDEGSWYRYLASSLEAQLNGKAGPNDVPIIWDQIGLRQTLQRLSRDLEPTERVVILLDEVNALPGSVSESFLSSVRAIFGERESASGLWHYTFVMTGSFIPDDLVRCSASSPFKVARRIYMSDADRDGIAKLIRNLETGCRRVSDALINTLYCWAGGDVYLAQCLCSLLERREENLITDEVISEVVEGILSGRHMRSVHNELVNWPEGQQVLRRILTGSKSVKFTRASRVVAELELTGLVAADEAGYCTVRNELYLRALADWYPELTSPVAEGEAGCALAVAIPWTEVKGDCPPSGSCKTDWTSGNSNGECTRGLPDRWLCIG